MSTCGPQLKKGLGIQDLGFMDLEFASCKPPHPFIIPPNIIPLHVPGAEAHE